MTRWSSSTFFLARPKVPSCERRVSDFEGDWRRVLGVEPGRTLFLANLRARLSLLLRSNSMTRRS